MPCYHPITAWRVCGQTKLVFQKPFLPKEELKIPCGQCIGCRLLKSVIWATRCMHEASEYDDNCFITVTYNDKNLPSDHSLNHDHFQRFMKRLRKQIAPTKIRFFMCGEYGDDTWRPHYHALIFNYNFPDKIRTQINAVDNPSYISEQLTKLWPYGNHLINELTYDTAAYVARYVTKKVTGDKAEQHYTRDIIDFNEVTGEIYNYQEQVQLKPEYAAMSRGGSTETNQNMRGIGYRWFEKYKDDCYPSDYLIKDGAKIPIPKYYDKLLEENDEYQLLIMKEKRKIRAQLHELDYTPERLKAREICKIKSAETLKRNKI